MGIIFIFANDLRMDAVSSSSVHSLCLLFTWLRAWESGKHDWDIWKEKQFSDVRVKQMWKETRDPIVHGQYQAAAYHSMALSHQFRHKPSFLWLFPQCPSSFPPHPFSGPWCFPEMLCLRLAVFREMCLHIHYLKYAFDIQKVINLKKINTQSVQWITYSSIIF